jgi:hypothetical protein
MKKKGVLYVALNALFHVAHIAIIGFVAIGWIFPRLLPVHLALALATLGSWFILGRWLGRGYCPVSDWHWRIKAALGDGRPQGTYIHQLLQNLSGQKLDSDRVDSAVVVSTFVVTAISLALNLMAWK